MWQIRRLKQPSRFGRHETLITQFSDYALQPQEACSRNNPIPIDTYLMNSSPIFNCCKPEPTSSSLGAAATPITSSDVHLQKPGICCWWHSSQTTSFHAHSINYLLRECRGVSQLGKSLIFPSICQKNKNFQCPVASPMVCSSNFTIQMCSENLLRDFSYIFEFCCH